MKANGENVGAGEQNTTPTSITPKAEPGNGKPTGGEDEPQAVAKPAAITKTKPTGSSRLGKHPNFVKHQYKPGESGNPDGRPRGIPNLNQELIQAFKRFKGGKGPGGKKAKKGFFTVLIEKALEEDPDLLKELLRKVLVDATPPPSADVTVNQQVINEQSYHQTILADEGVRAAATDLEERIGSVLNDSRGRGA